MQSTIVRFSAIAVVLLAAACAAIQQQKQQPVRADMGQFKNLKVLPQTITHDELLATMRSFARALGVKCNHCHVRNPPGSKDEFDFASDAKPEKNVARQMIRMANTVNRDYLDQINPAGPKVQCMTCHHGQKVPDVSVPAEAPRAPRPPQQPQTPQTPPAPQP